MVIRAAHDDDLDRLATIWFQGWRDGHLAIVPAALARLRTLVSFRERLSTALAETRVAITGDQVVGFVILKGDEIYQLFVAAEARGTGIAAALLGDAERELASRGFSTGWLACAIGNDRAAKFYSKHGWNRVSTMIYQAETSDGLFPIENWRYEKALRLADKDPI
jgi:ribosomal protein S18 acetylase RimI-like enzyme